jgi:integrase
MIDHLQQRNGRWLIVDLMGKHRRIRTVPMPDWVKGFVDAWLAPAGIRPGRVCRAVNKARKISGPSLTPQAVYEVARTYGYRAGLRVAPHDLRRTLRYLGLEQDLSSAPGDRIRLQIQSRQTSSNVGKTEPFLSII